MLQSSYVHGCALTAYVLQRELLKERKRMQRQSHIERVQMLESLERLKTFGGKPDATLMAMLGDSWNTESVPEPIEDAPTSEPKAREQIADRSETHKLPPYRKTHKLPGAPVLQIPILSLARSHGECASSPTGDYFPAGVIRRAATVATIGSAT